VDHDNDKFIRNITSSCPGLKSIWLIGSRANGTARENSDWDYIAFGDNDVLRCIENNENLHRSNTDFLVVTNDEDFRSAWGEKDKSGSLSEWEWHQLSPTEAQYQEAKWVENEEQAKIVVTTKKAVRVWRRNKRFKSVS